MIPSTTTEGTAAEAVYEVCWAWEQRPGVLGGAPVAYGPCARLTIGGVDVTRLKIVALKSSDHFRAAFRPLAAAIIGCHSRGLVSADLTTFDYQRLERPIWPLDRELTWEPRPIG
jgi:hypothetical protein